MMIYGDRRLPIPSYDELSVEKTKEMIAEVNGLIGRTIAVDEWNRL